MAFLHGYVTYYKTEPNCPQINSIKNYSELVENLDIELSYSTKMSNGDEA